MTSTLFLALFFFSLASANATTTVPAIMVCITLRGVPR